MGWRPVTSNAIDIKKQVGEAHVGIYSGKQGIETKLGKQVIWKFIDEFNQTYGIYGFTNLNRAMESIVEGTLCRITYNGTEKVQTKWGLKDVHMVTVEINDDPSPPKIDKEKEEVPF